MKKKKKLRLDESTIDNLNLLRENLERKQNESPKSEKTIETAYSGFYDGALDYMQYHITLFGNIPQFSTWRDLGNWAYQRYSNDYFGMSIYHCVAFAEILKLPLSEANIKQVLTFALGFGSFFSKLRE